MQQIGRCPYLFAQLLNKFPAVLQPLRRAVDRALHADRCYQDSCPGPLDLACAVMEFARDASAFVVLGTQETV